MKKIILLIFCSMHIFGCKGEAVEKNTNGKIDYKFSHYLFAYLPEMEFTENSMTKDKNPKYRWEDQLSVSVQSYNSYSFYKNALAQDKILLKQGVIKEKYSIYDERYDMMRYPDQLTSARVDFKNDIGMHNYDQYFIGKGADDEIVVIQCGVLSGELDGPDIAGLYKICQAKDIDIKNGFSLFYQFHYKYLKKWKGIHEGIKKQARTLGWNRLPSLNQEKYGSN